MSWSMVSLLEVMELICTERGPFGEEIASLSSLSSLSVLLVVVAESEVFSAILSLDTHAWVALDLLFLLKGLISCLGSAKRPWRNGVAMKPRCLGSAKLPLWKGVAR